MRQWIVFIIVGISGLAIAGWFAGPPLVALLDAQTTSSEPPRPKAKEIDDTDARLPSAAEMEVLARQDPIAFLKHCERKYTQTIHAGYTMTMQKQERINNQLGPVEMVEVFFRDVPYSVLLRWTRGEQLAAALYVEGENKGMILAQPAGLRKFAGVQERDPKGADARRSGRFPLTEFGLKHGLQRTRATWEVALTQNDLNVEYLGQQKLKQADDRLCYVFHRGPYKIADHDGVSDLTIWIDAETWLQVGVLAKTAQGDVIGEYYFSNIRLNPQFKDGQFERKALSP